MKREYDARIDDHYREVARESGLSATSTMADEITRQTETVAIRQFVGASLRIRSAHGRPEPAVIMDVGCGNGYTLEVLSKDYPGQTWLGLEKSDELRSLARSRFPERPNVVVSGGDIRDPDFSQSAPVDILICQRVIINLLDVGDQKQVLSNIIGTVRAGGALLFIECFQSPLDRLNGARGEFDLPPIPPAHHNLYLPDDFFAVRELEPFPEDAFPIPPNFLSTHYYVTRVIHPLVTRGKAMKRNSEFVRFLSSALRPNAGDYAPLKVHVFRKSASA